MSHIDEPLMKEQDDVMAQMNEADLTASRTPSKEVAAQRPWQVAVLSILIFLTSAWVIPLVIFSTETAPIPAAYAVYLAAAAGIGVLASIAAWMLKRWSLPVYGGISLLNVIVLTLMGSWNILLVLIPLGVLALGFVYRSKFSG